MVEGTVRFAGELGHMRLHVAMIYKPGEDKLIGDVMIEKISVYPNAPKLKEFGQAHLKELKKLKADSASKEVPAKHDGSLSPESGKEDDKK